MLSIALVSVMTAEKRMTDSAAQLIGSYLSTILGSNEYSHTLAPKIATSNVRPHESMSYWVAKGRIILYSKCLRSQVT